MKNCPYDFRDNSILERRKSPTKYGLKSFKNYGAKICVNMCKYLSPNNHKSAVSQSDLKIQSNHGMARTVNARRVGISWISLPSQIWSYLFNLFGNWCFMHVYHLLFYKFIYYMMIIYQFWLLLRIHVIHVTDHFNANMCHVLFPCVYHCFYSCQVIAVLQLRFCFYLYPTLNKACFI